MFTNLQEGDEVIKVNIGISNEKWNFNNKIFKINETPVDRLTLQEAQKLIDKAKERLVLFVIPNKLNNERISSYRKIFIFSSSLSHISSCLAIENGINNHQESTTIPINVQNRPSSLRKELQADYNQHIFDRSTIPRQDFMRSRYIKTKSFRSIVFVHLVLVQDMYHFLLIQQVWVFD
jgi:hypothetical protein